MKILIEKFDEDNKWRVVRRWSEGEIGIHSALQIYHRYLLNRTGAWRMTVH